jgi:hypothetical protein
MPLLRFVIFTGSSRQTQQTTHGQALPSFREALPRRRTGCRGDRGLITAAPPASAGCQYRGIAISRCDGPVQPDGTWQRCVLFNSTYGGLPGDTYSYRTPDKRGVMGPDLHPWGLAFNDPPTHIDD